MQGRGHRPGLNVKRGGDLLVGQTGVEPQKHDRPLARDSACNAARSSGSPLGFGRSTATSWSTATTSRLVERARDAWLKRIRHTQPASPPSPRKLSTSVRPGERLLHQVVGLRHVSPDQRHRHGDELGVALPVQSLQFVPDRFHPITRVAQRADSLAVRAYSTRHARKTHRVKTRSRSRSSAWQSPSHDRRSMAHPWRARCRTPDHAQQV